MRERLRYPRTCGRHLTPFKPDTPTADIPIVGASATVRRKHKTQTYARDRERDRVAEILRSVAGTFAPLILCWIAGVIVFARVFPSVSEPIVTVLAITPIWILTVRIASDTRVACWRIGVDFEQLTAQSLNEPRREDQATG